MSDLQTLATRARNVRSHVVCTEARWIVNQLRLIFGMLMLVILNANAFAGDYTVAYALEIGDQTETGKAENCEYVRQCELKTDTFGLSIFTFFIYPENRKAYVTVGGKKGCCYFTDGNESVSLDPRQPIPRIAIFEGHARVQNEFVQNNRLGTLYLRFLNLR